MAKSIQLDGERLISITSQHWIKFVLPVFIYIVLASVSVLLFILAGTEAHHRPWLSGIAFVTALLLFHFTHHWVFIMLLSESTTHIIVTNNRVILMRDRVFIDEELTEYAFEKMKTVEAKKHGILQTLLRYGSIGFESGAEISYIRHPNRVVRDIEQATGLK
jgi:hypothetical protein